MEQEDRVTSGFDIGWATLDGKSCCVLGLYADTPNYNSITFDSP